MQNSHDTKFDVPDAHFDNLICLFSDAQAKKFGNPKCIMTVKTPKNKKKKP
jgi:hypothetical protein